MATIVLTGATGLLGAEILAQLCGSGENEIVCLGRTQPGLEARGVRFVSADLSHQIPTQQLPRSADAIIHLAQSERFRDFPDGARDIFAVNVATPIQLLDWAAKANVAAFVHASTGGIYAPSDQLITEEGRLEHPERSTFYASTKHSAELLAAAYSSLFPVIALRYFFIYGKQQRKTMLMPRLVENVRAGRPITLQGDDGMRFNPIHVSDAARATILAAALKSSAVINVAGPEVLSMRGVGECIGAAIGKGPVFQIDESVRANHMAADIQTMVRLLNKPALNVAAGIAELCR